MNEPPSPVPGNDAAYWLAQIAWSILCGKSAERASNRAHFDACLRGLPAREQARFRRRLAELEEPS